MELQIIKIGSTYYVSSSFKCWIIIKCMCHVFMLISCAIRVGWTREVLKHINYTYEHHLISYGIETILVFMKRVTYGSENQDVGRR